MKIFGQFWKIKMKFELAFSTIREFGGYMKRLSYPELDYYIDTKNNVLKSIKHNDDEYEKPIDDDALVFGSDIMAEDWDVDLRGCWKE